MVALMQKDDVTYSMKSPEFHVIRPRPVPWCPSLVSKSVFNKTPVGEKLSLDLTPNSAFDPIEKRGRENNGRSSVDNTTQVTWSSVQNYRCSVSVSGSGGVSSCNSSYASRTRVIEHSSEDRDTKEDSEDDDEEIDVGSPYDTEISLHSVSAVSQEKLPPTPEFSKDTQPIENYSKANVLQACENSSLNQPQINTKTDHCSKSYQDFRELNYYTYPPTYFSPEASRKSEDFSKFGTSSFKMETESTTTLENSALNLTTLGTNVTGVQCSVVKRARFSPTVCEDFQNRSSPIVQTTANKYETFEVNHVPYGERHNYVDLKWPPSSSRVPHMSFPTEKDISTRYAYDSKQCGIDLSQRSTTGNDYSSICYGEDRRMSVCSTSSTPTPYYKADDSQSPFNVTEDVHDRRSSCGSTHALGISKQTTPKPKEIVKLQPEGISSFPTDSNESLCSSRESTFDSRSWFSSSDRMQLSPSSIGNYSTEGSENVFNSEEDNFQRSSSYDSKVSVNKHEHCFKVSPKLYSDEERRVGKCFGSDDSGNEQVCEYSTVSSYSTIRSLSTSRHDSLCVPSEEMFKDRRCSQDEERLELSHAQKHERTVNVVNTVHEYGVKIHDWTRTVDDTKPNLTTDTRQQRESVLVEAKKGQVEGHVTPVFSAEDVALRSRVLILLWVLLGESRLREVGYPVDPVQRILWRAVDVCCSVAGVKSAAAVPLNADHDCGSDMMCFRDHAHRFLEVCAPTREHWKQFGWASLTVDAVLKKIYEEELVPLLRIQKLPEDIKKAAEHLARLDRPPPVMQQLLHSKDSLKHHASVIVPIKKKRGRPAKITQNVEEGGRIERVMLWRFLLNLLEDPKNSSCIHWVQREEGIFRILNTDWLARLWGRRHGNPRMTYEKMARAMRTYYRSKVLQPVPRLRNLPRKLVYKFNPAVIHKVAAMKLSCSAFSGRGMNYNK